MGKIFQTVMKNFRVLVKGKFSLFILLLGPILITSLISFFYFNSNFYSISLGVHSPDNSEFNTFFVEELGTGQFTMMEYNSEGDCENAIKSGFVHACIYLPKDYKITDEIGKHSITVKLDTSRGEIVAITKNLISDHLSEISRKIQIKNTQNLIDTISLSENKTKDDIDTINSLTSLNSEIKMTTDNINVHLIQIQALYNPENFGIEDMKNKYVGYNNTIQKLSKDTLALLNESETSLIDGITIIDENNLTPEDKIDEIKSSMTKAKSKASSIESKVNSMTSSYFYKKLGDGINNIETKLNDAEDSASGVSGSVKGKISDNMNSLDNSSNSLLLISKSGENLLAKIDSLETKDAKVIVKPVNVNVENVIANSSNHLVSLFPSLIVGLIFIISLIMSSMFVLTERKSKAHFRNFMSNNSAFNFLISDFLTLFIIVFLQVSLIINLYYIGFLKIKSIEILYILSLVAPIIAIFVLIGMVIGYVTKNESSNVIFTFLVILLFLTFSGKLIPLEVLSKSTLNLILYNPYILAEGMIRKYLLFGVGLKGVLTEVYFIASYVAVFFSFAFILESFSKKRFLYGLYILAGIKIKKTFSRDE